MKEAERKSLTIAVAAAIVTLFVFYNFYPTQPRKQDPPGVGAVTQKQQLEDKNKEKEENQISFILNNAVEFHHQHNDNNILIFNQDKDKSKQSTKHSALLTNYSPSRLALKVLKHPKDGNIWIGWGRKEQFGEGWKTKGLLYGGNLSDGSSLLRSNFGPRVKENDIIETILERNSNQKISIQFILNGKSLGTGFDLTIPSNKISSSIEIFPLISFSAPSSSSSIVEILPNDFNWSGNGKEQDEIITGIIGSWKAIEVNIILQIQEMDEEGLYGFSARIGNVINCRLKLEETTWKLVGPIMSTKMFVDEETSQLEKRYVELIENIQTVQVVGNDENHQQQLELSSKWNDKIMFIIDDGSRENPVKFEEVERIFS